MQLTTTHKLDAKGSSVHSVTIFRSDCAEVVRKFTIHLKIGDNVVEIAHLPSTMDTDSLRVAGVGQALLSDVVCIKPKPRTDKNQGKSEILLELEDEREFLNTKRRVADHQASILVNYARSITGEHLAPGDMLTFLTEFTRLGEENGKALDELNKKQRDLDKKIAKEMDDPAQEHDSSHLRNIKVKLTINSEEDHEAEISLTYLAKRASWIPVFDLRATTGADGKPTSKLALHYRATVTQSTGEDWSDATLNLSTASPSVLGTKIPTLNSIKIAPKPVRFGPLFGPQQQQQRLRNAEEDDNHPSPFTQHRAPQAKGFVASNNLFTATAGNLFGQKAATTTAPIGGFGAFGGFGAPASAPAPATASLFGATAPSTAPTVPVVPPAPTATDTIGGDADGFEVLDPNTLPDMEIPGAVTKENSMAANFLVKGAVNIKSDGSSHRVAIAILDLNAKIHSVAVPRSMEGVYLQATIHNTTSDTHLLPGNVGIYLDDGYITNSTIPHVAPGDTFKCSLGKDYGVAITLEQKAKRIEAPTSLFGANKDRMLYTVTLTLRNKRDAPVKDLIVRDVVPFSDTPQVKVVLLKPEGLADTEEGKDVKVKEGVIVKWFTAVGDKGGMKEGRYQWIVDLDGKETKVLTTEWEVSSSPGTYWGYFTQTSTL